MKKGLLTAGILLTSLGLFVGMMTVAGAAVRYPVYDTVFSVANSTDAPGQNEQINFPYAIEQTPLVAERLVVYEGAMIDEDSDEPVVDTLALLVHNTGLQEILSVHLRLHTSETVYHFTGTHIPAKSKVLLIEDNYALWTEENYTDCTAVVAYAADTGLIDTEIAVKETGMGEVRITNLTDEALQGIRILHKNCLCEAEIYIGGITYQTEIGNLAPNQTISKTLQHYASGYSKIVRIEEAILE